MYAIVQARYVIATSGLNQRLREQQDELDRTVDNFEAMQRVQMEEIQQLQAAITQAAEDKQSCRAEFAELQDDSFRIQVQSAKSCRHSQPATPIQALSCNIVIACVHHACWQVTL